MASERQPTCILAEDDPASRMVMARLLEGLGFAVTKAGDGLMALELLRYNPECDILVTDEQMPRMAGTELVSVLRGDSKFQCLGIAIVSGVISIHEVAALLENGADRFVPKPLDHKRFAQEVVSLRGEVQARRTRLRRAA